MDGLCCRVLAGECDHDLVRSVGKAAKITVQSFRNRAMSAYTAVIEHCPDTQLYVGYIPGSRARTARAQRSMSCARIFAK
jgi:hypothetical protein